MTESKVRTDQPRKLLARGVVKANIALASGFVLAVGAWLAPRAAQTPRPSAEEHAAPLLEEQVQLREVSRPFVGVQEVAGSAMQHSVAVLLPVEPAAPGRNDYAASANSNRRVVSGFGVFVSDTHVLTHSAALDGHSVAEVLVREGLMTPAQVLSYEPPTGLVLLEVRQSEERAPVPVALETPAPGALAVAVGRSDERDFAVPVFVTSIGPDNYTIGGVVDALMPGMAVFNLAGELSAIAAPDGRTVRAIPVRAAAERMLARASSGERHSAFGLGFQALTGRLTAPFGNEGVVISEVLPGGPADAADIQVGDVLVAVGDVPVDSEEAGVRALTTAAIGAPTTLRVRRGTRARDVEATPVGAYEIAALARSRLDVAPGPEARVLFPPSVLAGSAIPPLARVLSVNGQALTTRAQVQRVLRLARRPVPVLLRDADSQFYAVVEPTR
jgi:S1-C subfamily serine protease